MENIHIWIDADSCPTLVRNHVLKISSKNSIPVTFVANKPIPSDSSYTYEMIICQQEKDAADNYILEKASVCDLVITRDIVFADKLVEKNITTINDRGTVFSKENVKQLLSNRDFDLQLANIGLVKHFNEGYNKEKFAKFANCFDKTLHQLMRK